MSSTKHTTKRLIRPPDFVFGFPPKALNPNARSGWREKARTAKEYRWACCIDARLVWGQREPLVPPVSMAVTFVVKDKRKRDMDNLIAMFKAGQDGMVDAGVLAGDHWQGLTVSYTVEQGPRAFVRVTV